MGKINPAVAGAAVCIVASISGVASATTPPPNWDSELPSVPAVQQAIHGSDAADTAARQDAAFLILAGYSGTLAQLAGGPTSTSTGRVHEYVDARKALHPGEPPRMPMGQAFHYFASYLFKKETLSAFVSPASLRAYETQDPLLEREASEEAQMSTRNAVVKRTADAQEAHTSELTERVTQSLAADRAAESPGKMTVFGIPLGQPLNLSPCPAVCHDPTRTIVDIMNHREAAGPRCPPVSPQTASCLVDGTTDNDTLDGYPVSTDTVSLAPGSTPDWFASADLRIVRIYGYAVAALLGPFGSRNETVIQNRLEEKYGAPRPEAQSDRVTCTNQYGIVTNNFPVVDWVSKGLHVEYKPINGMSGLWAEIGACTGGAIRIETATYSHMVDEARARHQASQPKL